MNVSREDVIRLLLQSIEDKGVDVTARNDREWTPFDLYCLNSNGGDGEFKDIVNEFLKVGSPLDATILVDGEVTQFDDKAEILNKFNINGCKAYQALHSCLKNSKSAEETVQKIAEAFGVDTSEYDEPSKKKKKSE